jgi:hypothetical protein
MRSGDFVKEQDQDVLSFAEALKKNFHSGFRPGSVVFYTQDNTPVVRGDGIKVMSSHPVDAYFSGPGKVHKFPGTGTRLGNEYGEDRFTRLNPFFHGMKAGEIRHCA